MSDAKKRPSSTATPANTEKKKKAKHPLIAALTSTPKATHSEGGMLQSFRKTLLEGLVPPGFSGVVPHITPAPVVLHNVVTFPTDNSVGSNTMIFKFTTAFNQLVR